MKLHKYNPSLLSDIEIIENFVAREKDLEILLRLIRENIGRSSNQHMMIIGSRGMGKTLLVLRAVAEIRQNEVLGNAWYPLVMAEESYMVGNAAEFWLEAILKLSETTKNNNLESTYEKLLQEVDNKILYEKALNVLLDFVDTRNKRLLIVVENFNMLFDEQMKDEDGWVLRETLIHEPRIMLVSTATSRFDQIDNIKQPMFELFAVRELKPLSPSDCQNIWKLITSKDVSKHRIRPIEILTGGNPRLLVILSSFAATSSFKELMENLISLVDDHTDYLKSNTENLPPLERKTFVALADIWSPALARDVAKATRVSVNQASNQLIRLKKRGAVIVQRIEGRKKYYQLSERLYNIYHQMRRRGGQSNRVRTAVKFMIEFYDDRELKQMVTSLSRESLELPSGQRESHFLAIEQILSLNRESQFGNQLVCSIDPKVFKCGDSPYSLKVLKSEIEHSKVNIGKIGDSTEDKGQKLGDNDRNFINENVFEFLVEMIKDDPDLFENTLNNYTESDIDKNSFLYRLAKLYFQPDTTGTPKAINYQKKYWKQVASDAWNSLGKELSADIKYPEAEMAFRKAIEVDPKYIYAWDSLGDALYKQDQYAEAEKAYRKAIELDPKYVYAWDSLGDTLYFQDQYAEAEKAYRKAIELDPKYIYAWDNLGDALFRQEQYAEAEKAYRKAIELDPKYVHAWSFLGQALYKQGQDAEAEKAYRKAIELDPKCVHAWSFLGQALYKQGQYAEAEKAYRKAIELDPKYVYAWDSLGDTLYNQNQYAEAEKAFRKAIELDPKYIYAWDSLGDTLYNQNQYAEAEKAFRKAIELDPDDRYSRRCFGASMFFLGRFIESKHIFKDLLVRYPQDSVSHNNFGYICLMQKQFSESEKAFIKAIELDPGCSLYYANLGIASHSIGNVDDSYKCFKKAIELLSKIKPDSGALNSLAWLCLLQGKEKYYPKAENWIKVARKQSPGNAEYAFTYARLLVVQSKWKKALEQIKDFLNNANFASHFIVEITEFFISAAKKGFAKESFDLLFHSPSGEHLEPLIVAIQKYLKKQTNAPLEIYEVAKDIVVEINANSS